MTTNIVSCTDLFTIPAVAAPVATTAATEEVEDLPGWLMALSCWRELKAMMGMLAIRPTVTSMWSRRAVATRAGGWVIDLVEDGQRITCDADMTVGSMVMEAASFNADISTLFAGPVLVGNPAFWTAFTDSAESGFGAGGNGWEPAPAAEHGGVFGPLAIELQDMAPGAEWVNPAGAGPRLVSCGSDAGTYAWVELTFGRDTHGDPVQITLSSPDFDTIILPLDGQYTVGGAVIYNFSANDVAPSGALAEGGVATVTATVLFD